MKRRYTVNSTTEQIQKEARMEKLEDSNRLQYATCTSPIMHLICVQKFAKAFFSTGHLHDDVISVLRPEFFRALLYCAN